MVLYHFNASVSPAKSGRRLRRRVARLAPKFEGLEPRAAAADQFSAAKNDPLIAKHVFHALARQSDFAGWRTITDAQSKDHRLDGGVADELFAAGVASGNRGSRATQCINTRGEERQDLSSYRRLSGRRATSADTLRAGHPENASAPGWVTASTSGSVRFMTTPTACTSTSPSARFTRPATPSTNPYYPHRTLAELCRILERDYNLGSDNHIPNSEGGG